MKDTNTRENNVKRGIIQMKWKYSQLKRRKEKTYKSNEALN
jgi:hypothetical protein